MELSKLMGCVKRPFIPSELFRDGLIDGAWFDPSDMSTMFQDAAGTIPVTAVEQPVGLILDKSQGLMLGPELVTNSTFDYNVDGWSSAFPERGTVTWDAAAKRLRVDNTAGSGDVYAKTMLSVVPSKIYKITVSVYDISGGMSPNLLKLYWYNESTYTSSNTSSVRSGNTFTTVWSCPAGTIGLIIGTTYAAGGGIYELDNVSVREIKGNHATQSITAARPTLSARYNLLTKTEDFSDAVWGRQMAGTASMPVVTNNYGLAPDGTTTAARLQLALNGGTTTTDRAVLSQQPTMISGTKYASTFWVKSNTAQSYVVQQRLGVATQNITIDQTWRAYTYSQTAASDNTHWLALRGAQGTSDAADILIWHPQLIIGATTGPYQRVNTATDYDTDPRYFPKYLRFDGIDDYLNLPYMGLYANGSVSVVMAGRASAQWGVVISEGSTTSGSPQFAPLLTTTETGDTLVVIRDDNNGNVLLHYTPSMFDKVSVVSSIISASDSKAYRDSVFKTALSYTRSTPVTMNTTAIGARVSTSVVEFFGGNIYGLIITKSVLTDAQRVRCERFLARKAVVAL